MFISPKNVDEYFKIPLKTHAVWSMEYTIFDCVSSIWMFKSRILAENYGNAHKTAISWEYFHKIIIHGWLIEFLKGVENFFGHRLSTSSQTKYGKWIFYQHLNNPLAFKTSTKWIMLKQIYIEKGKRAESSAGNMIRGLGYYIQHP